MVLPKSDSYCKDTDDILCRLRDMDQDGFHCLLDKVKVEIGAVQSVTDFLEKRAAIEQEYGKQMLHLVRSMEDSSKQQSGTYGATWTMFLKVHETIGEQRLRFSDSVTQVAGDLDLLIQDMGKACKETEEAEATYGKQLADAENLMREWQQMYELHCEDHEHMSTLKRSAMHTIPRKPLFKNSRVANQPRTEEYRRPRAISTDQSYQQQLQQLQATSTLKLEYRQTYLPKFLTSLKDVDDECFYGLRYQLARYAYAFEQAIASDGLALDDDHGMGLRALTERIDKDADLIDFIQSYTSQSLTSNDIMKSKTVLQQPECDPVFGVDLQTLALRDGGVPSILTRCASVIEEHGLDTVGIYRIPGISRQIQSLKLALNRDCARADLLKDGNPPRINNVTSVLKLWFRELPDPIIPQSLYPCFIEAAKSENEQTRAADMRLVVSKLPDVHYMTLKYLMCHLHRVQQHRMHNKMDAANLATVFGMTLMGNNDAFTGENRNQIQEARYQVQVIQTILENYDSVFACDDEHPPL